MDCFQSQFFYGNEISYACEEKRKLYVLRYFPVHCKENYHGAKNIPYDVVDKWFGYGYVKILSVGGGPGSDICGVLEYLEEEALSRQLDLSVDVVRLDIEDQWDEVFDDVMERFFPWVNYRTVHLNVSDGIDLISDENFDLVTISYLISELSKEACINLADEVGSVLVDGGVLIINDRPEGVVEKNIRSMFDRIELSYEESSMCDWAGYSYPNDVAEAVGPKFNMNSIMFVGVKL
ncbi:hypothetical protein A3224_14855 [Microbulbifer thermotolerans]|uniref:Methyltransferase domain-containing protein n=1 Tax=Microbulbifer thermotolerans TaxID=252514 RepID=A0A143HPQ0_MICTH|nr:hypothetical protein A3224_14855 [Microbulbifer thermotolerans]